MENVREREKDRERVYLDKRFWIQVNINKVCKKKNIIRKLGITLS